MGSSPDEIGSPPRDGVRVSRGPNPREHPTGCPLVVRFPGQKDLAMASLRVSVRWYGILSGTTDELRFGRPPSEPRTGPRGGERGEARIHRSRAKDRR